MLYNPEPVEAACACGSSIPVRKLVIEGQPVTLVALPLIFDNFRQHGKVPGKGTARELLDTVKIYNPIPAGTEDAYMEALHLEYIAFCAHPEAAK